MSQKRRIAAYLIVAIGIAVNGHAKNSDSGVEIKVLSGPPEYVTGGAALVEIQLPLNRPPFSLSAIQAKVNGRPVPKGVFDVRYDGRIYGVLSNLTVGDSVLDVRTPIGDSQLTLTNHPKTNGVLIAPF